MAEITVSNRNQIVIPRQARQALGIKAGDKLLVAVRGASIVLLRKPKSFHEAIRGLALHTYPKGRIPWRNRPSSRRLPGIPAIDYLSLLHTIVPFFGAQVALTAP